VAFGAGVVLEEVVVDVEAGAGDEGVVAVVAAGVFAGEGGEVADVDVVEACIFGEVAGEGHGFGGCGVVVEHFVGGVEAADVPGDVGAEVVGDELGDLFELGGAVILAWDDEGGDF